MSRGLASGNSGGTQTSAAAPAKLARHAATDCFCLPHRGPGANPWAATSLTAGWHELATGTLPKREPDGTREKACVTATAQCVP